MSSDAAEDKRVEVLYVGGEGGVEEALVTRAGVRFAGVPAGGLHGLVPWKAASNLIKLVRGCVVAYLRGRRERPAALFVTGGYASVPVSLAAWALRVPILVYLPDIEPGLAVRFISRLADRVAVTVEDSRAHFPNRPVVVTGYPVRAGLDGVDRAPAREVFGFVPDEPALLVMGGSRGARSINQALCAALERMLELTQVVHLTGELDYPWVLQRREALPRELSTRYHALPYLHQMGLALAAADLVVCRAGASTLGELPLFGLPAVLVPYPHAWRYQRVNADWLADRGAAVCLNDEQLDDKLLPTLRRLLQDEDTLAGMRAKMLALARPDAAAALAQELLALVHGGRGGRP